MKKLLTIFVCLLPFLIEAQTTYYVSTTGNDANNGTSGSPWLTLAHACSSVTTAGDTIYVNAGTYIETAPAMLAVGVSIKGAGISSHIISHYKANWNFNEPSDAAIALVSSTEGTNGNQEISNILLDGDNKTGNLGIVVRLRSNVSIHDITIKDFYINGISYFGSATNYETKPTTYSVNNTLYNFTIDNCTDSSSTWIGGGNINPNGQKDMTIHDGNLSDTSRAAGSNGDLIVNNRFGLGLKLYNLNCYKPSTPDAAWNFHFEIPFGSGGTEIYNVNFYGGDCAVDQGGNSPYDETYPYLFSVHDCYFEDTNPTHNGTHGKTALAIEGQYVKNVFMYNNTFKNIVQPFGITDGTAPGVATHDTNIVFRNNVCMNQGIEATGNYMNLIEINKSETGGTIYGLKIINNTIIPCPQINSTAIKFVNLNSTMRNIVIANNIITDSRNATWMNVDNTSGTMDSLINRNNILYNNAGSNLPIFSGNTVTNYINSGNINSNPLFNSPPYDLSLQAGSPAIGAAYPYGYGSDIGGLQYTTVAAPTISMSGNQSITVDSTTISAVATPVSGHTITSYSWTKLSGPTAGTIVSPSSNSTKVSSLVNGTYQYQCVATQDDSQTATGTVTVVVNIPAITNYKINFKVPHVFKNK